MNIIVFDDWKNKFSGDIIDHWRSLGHQVLFDPQWEAMKEADITFFYQASNTAVEGVQKEHTGKIYVQAVDIEVWAGQATAVDYTKVDGLFFMAKHIQDYVLNQISFSGNTALIKPGIDTKKYTLTQRSDQGRLPIRKIAYVVGDHRIWDVKRFDIAMQMLKGLMVAQPEIRWELHVRGTYSTHVQYNTYCQYLEENLGLKENLIWYPDKVEDMNAWLEDKDFFLLPSTKEAFSYATAEAMSKGIKPIINNWQGSKETWGKYVCDTYGEMLYEILRGENKPEEYRAYIVENYEQQRYLNELDLFLGIV